MAAGMMYLGTMMPPTTVMMMSAAAAKAATKKLLRETEAISRPKASETSETASVSRITGQAWETTSRGQPKRGSR